MQTTSEGDTTILADQAPAAISIPDVKASLPSVAELRAHLDRLCSWFGHMLDETTRRLAYQRSPVHAKTFRQIAPTAELLSVWAISSMRGTAQREDLKSFVRFMMDDYLSKLVAAPCRRCETADEGHTGLDKPLMLDLTKIQEPVHIGHNALLILCLKESAYPSDERKRLMTKLLADAIWTQQSDDGMYRMYFDGTLADAAGDLYPSQAMLALLEAYRLTGDRRYLHSVKRAVPAYRALFESGVVDPQALVFFANWTTRALRLFVECLLAVSDDQTDTMASAIDFALHLHELVVSSGFYDSLNQATHAQTCEVAHAIQGAVEMCALLRVLAQLPASTQQALAQYQASRCTHDDDGDASALSEDSAESMRHFEQRIHRLHACLRDGIRASLSALLAAQVIVPSDKSSDGGFGFTALDSTQRIGVCAHAALGLMKVIEWQEADLGK